MRALVVDHAVESRVVLRDVADAEAADGQLLIRIDAAGVNFGELPGERSVAGAIPGWEAAGVVERAAAADSTYPVGSRVLTWAAGGGGWAERRAVDLAETAAIPDGVSSRDAATLPVAALTAFRALKAAGSVLGRRVLITGASGGVGGFGVQLAALGGAHVTAVASDPAQAEVLRQLGADVVAGSVDGVTDPVDVVLDSVGGPGLADVIGHLALDAQVYLIGAASWQPTELAPMALTMKRARLIGFQKGPNTSADLGVLLALVAAGRLDTRVTWHEDWSRIDELIGRYRRRELRGKAVLQISGR